MLNVEDIMKYIENQKKAFVTDVRLRQSDESIMIYVPQDKVAPRVKTGFTSLRQLNNLKKDLAEKYSRPAIVILIHNDAQQDLESGFYQMLNRKFNGKIISLYISLKDKSVVDAYIEVSDLTEQLQNDISTHFETILEESDFQLGAFQWLNSPSYLPTPVSFLRVLKSLQPANLQELKKDLQKTHSSVSDEWLNRKLDQLRKKGLIMRQKDAKTYVLTSKALGVIPAGAKRTSSDIDRALALGRRKW